MKLEINFKKEHGLILAALIVIFSSAIVIAENEFITASFAEPQPSSIPTPGHSSGDIAINLSESAPCGGDMSLQQAIDLGCMGNQTTINNPSSSDNSEFTVLKISHIIRKSGASCPTGYEKMEIGNPTGTDNYGASVDRYWDCKSGTTLYDGCAAINGTLSQMAAYNVLCLSTTNKLHYLITSINNQAYATCPNGWFAYDAPAVVHTNGKTYWSYWDCANGVTKQAGCTAVRTGTLITATPSGKMINYGRMCISSGDNSVSYLVMARNAACPSGWTKTLASDNTYWDCSSSLTIQGGCVEKNGDADQDNKYGALCMRT